MLWALLIGLGFGIAQTEVFVPEAHDGDTQLAVSTQGTIPGNPSTPAHDPSSPHVCHCAHAHGLVLLTAGPPLAIPEHVAQVGLGISSKLDSISLPPLLRPPIA